MADQETGRRLAAVLAADVAGYSRLAGADEERTLARLRALRGDLIDPAIAAHRGRVVKRAGDGTIVEFRSVIDAARCALEVQSGMVERNAGVAPERQILFRIGVHIGDVVGEADGDLMGDGVNIAARLEGICEPGGIVLSEDAYRQVRDRLEVAFTDLGERDLKNIARPVKVYSLQANPNDPSPPLGGEGRVRGATPGQPTSPYRAFSAGPSLSPLKGGEGKTEAPRLSIVVLPFANIGGDAEQEYFVDGVTESLTTDLSRISGSFVIGRNTAFTYKGNAVDLKQIGRELNVRYVLEGSVQRGGNRLRVNVQLIDAATGNHLWAERFDKPVADLFDMQDEIVARLANELNTELVAAEARRAECAPHPDSMDFYFQGRAYLHKGELPDHLTRARDFFERALALDPNNIEALVGAAGANMQLAVNIPDDRAAHLAAAEAAATKALSLAPNHAHAHLVLGSIYTISSRAAQAIFEYERALALDRNQAHGHAVIGLAKIALGRSEEVEPHVLEALRLSPRDVSAYHWMHVAGLAKLCLGSDEEAAAWMRRSIEANRNWVFVHLYLAAALAHLGRQDEARAAAKAASALNPNFTIGSVRGVLSHASSPICLAQCERIYDGMRKAGVPEG